MSNRVAFFGALSSTLIPALAAAETFSVQPGDDIAGIALQLQPGDELAFAPGSYDLDAGLDLALTGTSAAYILLRGAEGVVLTAPNGVTTLRIAGAFVAVDGLEIQGPGIALALNGTDFVVRGNTFTGGTVGVDCEACTGTTIAQSRFTDLSAAAVRGLLLDGAVRDNWIHDVDLDGVALEAVGSTVVDNVIEALGGDGIRTAFPDGMTAGNGNIIRGNFVGAAMGDAIATTGGALITNNVVAGFGGIGIASNPGESPAVIAHNTVWGSSTCFSGAEWSLSPTTNVLANNALYCEGGTAIIFGDGVAESTIVTANVFLGAADVPGDSVVGAGAADFVAPAMNDFYPSAASPLINAAEPVYAQAADYNGTARDATPDVGAYEVTTPTNPGAPPGGRFKDADEVPPPDGDMGGGIPGPDMGDDAGGPSGGASAGGTSNFPERERDGCSCASASGSTAALPLALLLGLTLRRRRRRSA